MRIVHTRPTRLTAQPSALSKQKSRKSIVSKPRVALWIDNETSLKAIKYGLPGMFTRHEKVESSC